MQSVNNNSVNKYYWRTSNEATSAPTFHYTPQGVSAFKAITNKLMKVRHVNKNSFIIPSRLNIHRKVLYQIPTIRFN